MAAHVVIAAGFLFFGFVAGAVSMALLVVASTPTPKPDGAVRAEDE